MHEPIHPARLQTVLGAMSAGLVTFTIVALVVRPSEPNEAVAILPYVVLLLGVCEIVAGLFVRRSLLRPAVEDLEASVEALQDGLVPGPLFGRAIVTAALATGVGVFASVTLFLGGPYWLIAVTLVCVVVVLLQLPNTKRWIEELRDRARG